ncbi:MAG: hypothetical protein OEV85_08245 [Candidatus Thorarchaeota archaeon]|nr:hypothetical protein [Candidatus Thorarchaeota archaeon]
MKPLGTITVYFPFIDPETRHVLETIMKESDNYFDFANALSERVLDTDCSDLLVYFAIHHAAQLLDLKKIDSIGQKYPEIPIIQPNLGFANHYMGRTDDFRSIIQNAEAVLAKNPDNWLKLEMRFMKFEAETFNYPGVIHDSSNIAEIHELIDSDPRFKFYETVLYSNLAQIADKDGNSEEWNRCNQIALQNARLYDDQIRLAYCLIKQSRISSNDRILAMKLLREALEIMDALGSTDGYADVLEQLGTISMIRGEFTNAIDYYLKSVSIRERLELETGMASLMLASVYNSVGECESGLEWAQMADDQFKGRPSLRPRAIMCQAWSLVLLDRLSEAELILDTVHELVLKSGRESHLGWLNFVIGLIEFSKGNVASAVSSLEESLKIFESHDGLKRYRNMSLYYLARIEVAQAGLNTEIFPYLALLEEQAVSEDLPGLMGQALVLKSDLALIQHDDSSLRDILQSLNELAEKPGLQFLVPYIEKLMSRI